MEVNYWTTPPRWWLNNPYIQHPNITQLPVIAIGGTKNTLSPRWDWPVDWAVPHLVSIVTTLNAASAMTNKQAAEQIIATGETGISQFLDDYCGTPPRTHPLAFSWAAAMGFDYRIRTRGKSQYSSGGKPPDGVASACRPASRPSGS